MMKTVTVTLEEIVTAFSASMTDYLLNIEDNTELGDATETFLQDLRNLLVIPRALAPSTLRRLAGEGFTMMMLPPTVFEELEVAHAEGHDFCLVVRHDGATLCILCKGELMW
jgi:hypothetical protein